MSYIVNSQKNLPSQKIQNHIKSFKKGKESKMKELSREERKEQHILNLENQISHLADKRKKEKWLRTKLTFFILSGFIFYILLEWGVKNDVEGLLWWLIFSPLIAIGVMFISYAVLAYIINGVLKDTFAIGQIVGRKEAIELSKLNEE